MLGRYTEAAVTFYEAFTDLMLEQGEWSQKTFGTDAERGPVGALKHLSKEALEAAQDPTNITEYADCLILLMDAIRRAGHNREGFKWMDVLRAAKEKMKVNKARNWPAPTASDEPVEHDRSKEA